MYLPHHLCIILYVSIYLRQRLVHPSQHQGPALVPVGADGKGVAAWFFNVCMFIYVCIFMGSERYGEVAIYIYMGGWACMCMYGVRQSGVCDSFTYTYLKKRVPAPGKSSSKGGQHVCSDPHRLPFPKLSPRMPAAAGVG